MALGTFTVTIDGNRLGAGVETAAKIQVKYAAGREFVKDDAAGVFVFPHVSSEKLVEVSLPHTLTLVTDVTVGESTEIGYEVTIITNDRRRLVAGPFAAQAAGAAIDLTAVTSDFEGIVPESFALRAETAATDAEAAAAAAQAVGSTNDTIIAGRINDPASATATALSATIVDSLDEREVDASGFYNLRAKHLRVARAGLGKARNGTGYFRLAGLGDSTMAGTGAGVTTGHVEGNPISQITALLESRGYPRSGTGVVVPYQESAKNEQWTTYADANWTDFGRLSSLVQGNDNAAPLVFTSTRAGTVVNVFFGNSGGAFTVAIDGGAAVTVTPVTGDTFGTYTVTGLANTTHTVTITRISSNPHIMGVEVQARTSGVRGVNLGIGGQKSSELAATQWFANRKFGSVYFNADLVVVLCMINDAGQGVTVATQKTNLTTVITEAKTNGADVLLVTGYPSATAVVPQATQDAFVAGHYELADTLDVPLLDLHSRWAPYTESNGYGLMGDQLHPNAAGYGDTAAAIVGALVGLG